MATDTLSAQARALADLQAQADNYPELGRRKFTSIGEADQAIQRVNQARNEIKLPGYSGTLGSRLFEAWEAANSFKNSDPEKASIFKKAIIDKVGQYRPGYPEWAIFMGIADQASQDYAKLDNERLLKPLLTEFGNDNAQTRAIAQGLVNQGVKSVKDLAVKTDANGKQVFYNKSNNQPITSYRFGMLGDGQGGISGGDLFFNLTADASGNISIAPDWSPRAGGVLKDLAPVIGIGLLLVPGIGQSIGASILGGSAATVAATVGLSVTAVTTAVGAATISAGMTALQGGSVEDVIKSGVSAAVSSGLNVAAGGGVSGAVAGSVAGTVIKGGDATQIVTNAIAAGVGAGVQGALPDNPDAGAIIGSATRTYIATGGNMDQTLLNAAATSVGTLIQSNDGTSSLPKTSTSIPVGESFNYGGNTYQELEDGTAQVTNAKGNTLIIPKDSFQELKQDYATDLASGAIQPAGGATLAPVTVVGSTTLLDTTYNLLSNGGAEYVDSRGTKRTLSPQEWLLEQDQLGGTAAPTLAPVKVTATTLPPSLDTQILSLMDATTAPTLSPVSITATTELPTLSPTLPAPTLPGVTVSATTGAPTLPPWWEQMTANPTLPVVTVSATTELPTILPTLPPVTISATTELPTLPPWWDQMTAVPTLAPVQIVATTELPTLSPTLPPVTVSATTELPTLSPTLPPVVVTATTELPTLSPTLPPVVVTATTEIPTLPPPVPTLPPVTIAPTTEPPTLSPTLPPETTPPVTTLPPATTAPPTIKPTKAPTYPVVIGVTPEPTPRVSAPSTITGVSPARLLADALAAYRPAGAIEGEESGKERQNVWNEKSLRLKDALGL